MTFRLDPVKQSEQISYFVTKTIAVTTVVDISAFSFLAIDLTKAIECIISIHKNDAMVTFDGTSVPNGISAIIVGALLTNGSNYTIEGNTNINNLKIVSANNVAVVDVTLSLGKLI